MTLLQIESAANRGDLATGDFQAGVVLRRGVIPAFLEDCGREGWRRKYYKFSTSLNTQAYPLPGDFFEAAGVFTDSSFCGCSALGLDYIGEDPDRVVMAELNTTPGGLDAYYLAPDPADANAQAIKFSAPADGAHSVVLAYYWYIPISDDRQDLDMRAYIPEQYHWALVEALKREIYEDRFGQQDSRFQVADAKYKEWIAKISVKREMAARERAVYVR